jgi:hypothetical protein
MVSPPHFDHEKLDRVREHASTQAVPCEDEHEHE